MCCYLRIASRSENKQIENQDRKNEIRTKRTERGKENVKNVTLKVITRLKLSMLIYVFVSHSTVLRATRSACECRLTCHFICTCVSRHQAQNRVCREAVCIDAPNEYIVFVRVETRARVFSPISTCRPQNLFFHNEVKIKESINFPEFPK